MTKSGNNRRGPWSAEEDNELRRLVDQIGVNNWVRIAQEINTRTAKQCRERWHQNLKPGLNLTPITPDEGMTIEKMVSEQGPHWATIARTLGGRSDNMVKNWWNGGQNRRRRKENTRKHESTLQRGTGQGQQPNLVPYQQPVAQQPLPQQPPSYPARDTNGYYQQQSIQYPIQQQYSNQYYNGYYSQQQAQPQHQTAQHQLAPQPQQSSYPQQAYIQPQAQHQQQQQHQTHNQHQTQYLHYQQQPSSAGIVHRRSSNEGPPSLASDGSTVTNVSPHSPGYDGHYQSQSQSHNWAPQHQSSYDLPEQPMSGKKANFRDASYSSSPYDPRSNNRNASFDQFVHSVPTIRGGYPAAPAIDPRSKSSYEQQSMDMSRYSQQGSNRNVVTQEYSQQRDTPGNTRSLPPLLDDSRRNVTLPPSLGAPREMRGILNPSG